MATQASQRPRGSSTAAKVRKRVPVSCMSCRVRKLKCDRSEPCYNCLQRNEECSYAADARPTTSGDTRRANKTTQVQDRIKHLEALVISLMQERDQTHRDGSQAHTSPTLSNSRTPPYRPEYPSINGSPTSDRGSQVSDLSTKTNATHIVPVGTTGRILNREGEAGYVGPEHWKTILESLADVREFLIDDESPEVTPDVMDIVPRTEEPYLLMPQSQMFNRMEILSSIPDKPDCDQLVYRYINNIVPTRVMIHGPTFSAEYERFWQNSDTATNTWLAVLFGIMCLSVGLLRRKREPLPPSLESLGDVASIYRVRCAQCLINANYSKMQKYTLEALVIYSLSEFLRSKDIPTTTGLILELAISMAIRAGYHRDPSSFGDRFTPFETEMRRRVWCNLVITDISMSFDVGKPRGIHNQYVDTRMPGNYAEEDFDEYTQHMPPERSDEEPTYISYTRSELRVIHAFCDIYDASQRVTPLTYDEVLQLERKLNDAYVALPAHMHIESREIRNLEISQALIWQYNVGMVYQKARCTLHRPYTFGLDSQERQNYSRDMCQEAALEILKYQRQLQAHLEPGGPLHKQWFFSPKEIQDSILAAMLVCRDLSIGYPGSPTSPGAKNNDAREQQRRREQISALEGTCLLWNSFKNISGDAYKAYLVVSEVLRKQKPLQQQTPPPKSVGAQLSSIQETNPHLLNTNDPSVNEYYNEVMNVPLPPPMQVQQYNYNGYTTHPSQVPQLSTAPMTTSMPQYQYTTSMPPENMWAPGLYNGPIYNGHFGNWQPSNG